MSSSDRIRLLIIGAGKMGAAHAHAFATVPEVEIVGITSWSGETAGKLAAAIGVATTGTDWRDVAKRTGAHAAVVAVSHEVNEAITGDVIEPVCTCSPRNPWRSRAPPSRSWPHAPAHAA